MKYNYLFTTLFTFLLLGSNLLLAQENKTENGLKVGEWEEKDNRGYLTAKGTYQDDIRTGKWFFYVSPVARYTKVPDVEGNYNDSGMKTGKWTLTDSKTKMTIVSNFENNLLEGETRYYNEKGELLAKGLMNTGIRHGKWFFYENNAKKTEGFYQDGVKIDTWVYDYYPEPETHVKGEFTYNNGVRDGRIEYYRVENHPIFGRDELLSGVGKYTNGRKTGRWIEYQQGLKGQLVQTGNYTRAGKKNGYWRTTLGRKNYEAATYKNGVLDGAYKQYHDNGKLQYETNFTDGLEIGEFIRYYANGSKEEQGAYEHSTTPDAVTRDTTYFELALPLEYHFMLTDLDFGNLQYHYITWLTNPEWSVVPAELDRRFNLYKDYGREPSRRYTKINVINKKLIRTGEYKSFHKNGSLKLTGKYYPKVTEVFNPETNTIIKDFARDGEWKQYDDNGYLMRTLYYDKGDLIRILDDKGLETGTTDDNNTPELPEEAKGEE